MMTGNPIKQADDRECDYIASQRCINSIDEQVLVDVFEEHPDFSVHTQKAISEFNPEDASGNRFPIQVETTRQIIVLF